MITRRVRRVGLMVTVVVLGGCGGAGTPPTGESGGLPVVASSTSLSAADGPANDYVACVCTNVAAIVTALQ